MNNLFNITNLLVRYIFLTGFVLIPVLCFGQENGKKGTSSNERTNVIQLSKKQVSKSKTNVAIKRKTASKEGHTLVKKSKAAKKNTPARAAQKSDDTLTSTDTKQTQSSKEKFFESCNQKMLYLKSKSEWTDKELAEIKVLEERLEILCKQLEEEDCKQ